jgi:hypothetical protein
MSSTEEKKKKKKKKIMFTMIDSKSPKFVEKLQQSLSLFLSLGHSRTTKEVWSSKKKLTIKRRWSIQAVLILSLNKWWTPNPNKNKTKTLPVFPVLSPYMKNKQLMMSVVSLRQCLLPHSLVCLLAACLLVGLPFFHPCLYCCLLLLLLLLTVPST